MIGTSDAEEKRWELIDNFMLPAIGSQGESAMSVAELID